MSPSKRPDLHGGVPSLQTGALHPSWLAFLRVCTELKYGEIERLTIQDGLPVLAETTKKKIKFTRS